MQLARAIPLDRKLMLIIMATTGAALLLAGAAFVGYEILEARRTFPARLTALAEMIGTNSKGAISFNDRDQASQTLATLSAQPQIVAACVYLPSGDVFAKYPNGSLASKFSPPIIEANGYHFQEHRLALFHQIVFDGEWIATVYLESDLALMYERIQRYGAIASVVLLTSLLFAFILSVRLRRIVSEPILRLAQTAQIVATDKDYSVRATGENEDELGRLIKGFNEMLVQIQVRDDALRQARDELEIRVKERTTALSQANEQLEREVEEREDAQAKHRVIEDQLRQSQKMEAIGKLAAGVAHDFNNIMTIIQGFNSLALADKRLPPEIAKSLANVSVAAERAATLTRQLLTFGRKQVMQLKSLDLNEVVSHVMRMLGRVIEENISVEYRHAFRLPSIRADAGMMEQLITNLVVNARDAMPGGGSLTISTQSLEIPEDYAKINPEARAGHFVRLSVSDTGCGMEPETIERLFEPFFTTKEIGKGTGLGLATVYGIVKQHHGWIEVSSKPGLGSAFLIFFPALPETARLAPDPIVIEPAVSGGTETILVVEDETALRELTRTILQKYGYTVLEAENAADALALWRKHGPDVDLVLTDIIMPGKMNGFELASQLRREKQSLPVICISGYSREIVGPDVGNVDGLNFLSKPYAPTTLARAVRCSLDGEPFEILSPIAGS